MRENLESITRCQPRLWIALTFADGRVATEGCNASTGSFDVDDAWVGEFLTSGPTLHHDSSGLTVVSEPISIVSDKGAAPS